MTRLVGIGVQPGVVVGPVRRVIELQRPDVILADLPALIAGMERVADDLDSASASAAVDVVRDVLQAQAMIARDPGLQEAIEAEFVDGSSVNVIPIVERAIGGFRDQLLALGGYFAERVADLDEIADRLLNKMAGIERDALVLHDPSVVVARDLTPADTSTLDRSMVLAIVVERGGPTSHTAIVARSLGIPAIVGCAEAERLVDGTLLLVDGRAGVAIINASADEIEQRTGDEVHRRARAAAVTGLGRTKDDVAIALLGNAGNVADCSASAAAGAEGIGLFRTELVFLDRQSEPSIEEQVEIYTAAIRAMNGRKVIFRTLDVGSDKPAPFINVGVEQNPSLGVRGWRLTRVKGETAQVIDNQITALARAAKESGGEVWVMAPMVATVAEAADFAQRARAAGIAKVGVMIETPAAALLADRFFDVVDFASIGTNDLSQYVMAADRLDERLADLLMPWEPALLAAVALAGKAATSAGKPLGLCGEAAADPALAPVLVGLGVTSLSMSSGSISEVRATLADFTLAQCQEAATIALAASDGPQARAQVCDRFSL
jgi:phosphoenolpyruvate-protein phosphotransferase (PTS system enzyme I)